MEPVREFQPGDVVEVSIPIEHAANLAVVKAAFVHEEHPRDVRFELTAELSPGEALGTTLATFTFKIPPSSLFLGEYKLTMLRVDTYAGRENVLVEDAPVIHFRVIPERHSYLRANGYDMRRLGDDP